MAIFGVEGQPDAPIQQLVSGDCRFDRISVSSESLPAINL